MRIFTPLFYSFLLLLPCLEIQAQGCVAARSFAGCGGNTGAGVLIHPGEFMIGTNIRHFKSFRHFRGDHQETERVENGTEVINKSDFIDFTVLYGISNRLYANATLPFVFHYRSSMYEHGGNPPNGLGERHSTSSSGLSDVRFGLGYWLFNPAKKERFNYAVGLGVKLNTGKYDYKDTFYNQGPEKNQELELVVDQSIQPGDGGVCLSMDLQGYHILSDHFSINSNFLYVFGFAESNGVLIRNQPAGGVEFAVPDQYLARIGASYVTSITGLSFSGGLRLEGVPAEDIFGGSNAYRRPGYVISAEPGMAYSAGRFAFNVSVPVAIERNRVQSYLDKKRTEETGVYTQGDAAFADYVINFGLSYRLGGGQMRSPISANHPAMQ